MPTPVFDSAYILAEQTLAELELRIDSDQLPNASAFDQMRSRIEHLTRLCPTDQEGQLRELVRQFNELQLKGKEQYVRTIDLALSRPDQLLDSYTQISGWIDDLARLFHDRVLAGEKRQQLNQIQQNEQARRLLQETESQIETLWAEGQAATVDAHIIKAFDDARDASRAAVQQAIRLKAPGQVLAKLRDFDQQAAQRYEEARKRHQILLTLDQSESYSQLIAEFEALTASNPDALVTYYSSGREVPELIPVSEALKVAQARWQGFVKGKAREYREAAEQKLATHDPEAARALLDQLWKLDVPSPETLLDEARSPIDITRDLRNELKKTLDRLKQAETELHQFRSLLEAAQKATTPEEAREHLAEAERMFPQFVEKKDRIWSEVRPGVIDRYESELRNRLAATRAALARGDYREATQTIDQVQRKAQGFREFEEIAHQAARLKPIIQDIQKTLHEITEDLKSRQSERVRDAQTKLIEIKHRLQANQLDNLSDINIVQAKVEAAIRNEMLLTRLRTSTGSYELATLQAALDEAHSAADSIPDDRIQELSDIRAFLEARRSLILGRYAYERSDLQSAADYLQLAAQHPQTRAEAQEDLRRVRETELADAQVQSALDAALQLPPCQAVESLRTFLHVPTRLRQELNNALKSAEDRCRQALEASLIAARVEPDFDVETVRGLLNQLSQIDSVHANALKQDFAPLIADREAHLAWQQRRWTVARERWEQAAQTDSASIPRFLAALKQETLELVDFFVQADPRQAVDELEQKLARSLPGDPHLLFALAQAWLAQTYQISWAESEVLFGQASQVVDRVIQRSSEWRRSLPKYEQIRQSLLAALGEPLDALDALVKQARALAERILLAKGIARRKARIEGYLHKRSFLQILRAAQEHERLVTQLQDDPMALSEFEIWWGDLLDHVILELTETLDEITAHAYPIRDLGGLRYTVTDTEAADVWKELETRLIILVLEPNNPQGRQAGNELPNQVALLAERFHIEIQNMNGTGLPGPEDKVLDQQIEHLTPLYIRMQTLGSALDHLTAHAHVNNLIQPPNSSWKEQRENFHRLSRPFQEFLNSLSRFKALKDKLDQQIQTTLCTGDWEPIHSMLNPSDSSHDSGVLRQLLAHRTFIWLKGELQRNIALRNRQVRRRDEVIWCLRSQETLDAREWQEHISDSGAPRISGQRAEHLTGDAWAEHKWHENRQQAQMPVEVVSLLELALDRLNAMQREDPNDACCLEFTLVWTDPITRRECVGPGELVQALMPLISQIDQLRHWLHPITGGRLHPPRTSASIGASDTQSAQGQELNKNGVHISPSGARRFSWKQICREVDGLRRERRFEEAINQCRCVIGEQTTEVQNQLLESHMGSTEQEQRGRWSLARTQAYLRADHRFARHLYTGLAVMLAAYADGLRREVDNQIHEARRIITTIEGMQSQYEIAWQDFRARLGVYVPLYQRSRRPIIGWFVRAATKEARWSAIQAYERCCALCPNHQNLLAQRAILEIDGLCPKIIPLFDEVQES